MTKPPAPAGPDVRILVVDDDADAAELISSSLRSDKVKVERASSAEEALECCRTRSYSLVLADLQLPGQSGIDLVARLRHDAPDTQVVVVTGFATVQTAVRALKLGAADYLTKPLHPEHLRALVATLTREAPSELPTTLLAAEKPGDQVFEGMLSRSPTMREVFERIELVAATDATVLIIGETGTGKELVARAVHHRSPRAKGPFIPVHTGALPKELIEAELFGHEKGAFTGAVGSSEGKFGAARGGTIFLDEISTMPERAQVDLLRVLETFRYTRVGGKTEHVADVRVVCATNVELLDMVAEGKFREDLYYRVAIFPIRLPPLRERKEDIPLLADRFQRLAAERFGKKLGPLPAETEGLLAEYSWPGNVRELRNVIEQLVLITREEVLSRELVQRLLGDRPVREIPPVVPIAIGTRVAEAERELARRTVQAFHGDRERAARALDIDRTRLDELVR